MNISGKITPHTYLRFQKQHFLLLLDNRIYGTGLAIPLYSYLQLVLRSLSTPSIEGTGKLHLDFHLLYFSRFMSGTDSTLSCKMSPALLQLLQIWLTKAAGVEQLGYSCGVLFQIEGAEVGKCFDCFASMMVFRIPRLFVLILLSQDGAEQSGIVICCKAINGVSFRTANADISRLLLFHTIPHTEKKQNSLSFSSISRRTCGISRDAGSIESLVRQLSELLLSFVSCSRSSRRTDTISLSNRLACETISQPDSISSTSSSSALLSEINCNVKFVPIGPI